MRELVSIALLLSLAILGIGEAAAESPSEPSAGTGPADAVAAPDADAIAEARALLTNLLFSDAVDRIDYQATTYEEGTAMINITADTILGMGVLILGDAKNAAVRGREVLSALNAGRAKGLYSTFEEEKQTIFVRNRLQAEMLGELVGTTISVIHDEFGAGGISYQDKATKMFKRVRVDGDANLSLLELYMDTAEFVENLSSKERLKYFR